MTENRNNTKRLKKNESGIHGKDYERKTLALIALKCLFHKEIKDFWLLSNPEGIEKFDDIILHVEYKNGRKNLFMMQIKHKSKGTQRPIIADKLDGTDKELSLKMYEEAFADIRGNKSFFENNNIDKEVDIFYILYNNCKVTQEVKNDNICFRPNSDQYVDFIDSSSKPTNVLKIENRESRQKYDEHFFKCFYFYTEQLCENSMFSAINDLLKINKEITKTMINFFYDWANPKYNTEKLYKLDINVKLLEIILGDFRPPIPLNGKASSGLMKAINQFKVTVICHESSSNILWNDILHTIRNFYQDLTIELSFWDQPIAKSLEEKLFSSNCEIMENFILNRNGMDTNITTKHLFLIMVSQSLIPFFIRTDNSLFKTFKNYLLPFLNINSVVFKVKKGELRFGPLKIFKNLNDMNWELYVEISKRINISFQGKSEMDLFTLIKCESDARKGISADVVFNLLNDTVTIGQACELPKYYINRGIKVPLLTKNVLDEREVLFLIDKFPKNKSTKEYPSIDLNEYLTQENFEKYNIVTTQFPLDPCAYRFQIILNLFKSLHITYYILKYVPAHNDFSLSLIYTNGSLDILRPYLTTVTITDTEIVNYLNNCKANIICNNAGMGKSMLLNFLNLHFSPEEWVIHVQLGKCDSRIREIKTLEELSELFFEHNMKPINPMFQDFLKALYVNLKYNIIWLIDDYDEVNEPRLLKLFANANKQGFRIWIVTRPLLKSEFENIFNIFPIELTEFDKNDQILFTKKYLEEKGTKGNDIEKIMKEINTTRNMLEDSFIGISQQTMMLVEIFLKYRDIKKWRIDDLYEKFITLKTENHSKEYRDFFLRTASKLALKMFFTEIALKEVFDLEEFHQDVSIFKSKYPKDDLITGFSDNDLPNFSHRTYAEFLVARWLVHTLKKQINLETPFNTVNIVKMLYSKELTTVRLFFDNMLVKELPFHSAIVNREEKNIADIFSKRNICLYQKDLLGRSIFHIMASYGNRYEIGTSSEIHRLIRNVDEHAYIQKSDKTVLLNIPGLSEPNTLSVIERVLDDACIRNEVFREEEDEFLKCKAADYAVMSGSLFELDKLLNYVSDKSTIDFPDETRYFVLFHSIRDNLNNILANLDTHDISHIRVGPSRMSLLHLAVVHKNIPALQKMLNKFCINSWGVDNEGNSPLHLASNQKDDGVLKLFLNMKKINVEFLNLKNANNQSMLYFLACQGHDKCILKIMNDFPGIDIDYPSSNGNTPLMASIINRNITVAALLLNKGANVNHRNRKGLTALHYSSSKGFYECTMKLILWQADLNCQDNYGLTPLMKASKFGHINTAKLLLKRGANVNLCDNAKWTALHHAIKNKKIKIASLLLENHADVNGKNKKGNTPLMMACIYDVAEAISLLLNKYSKKVNCFIKQKDKALNIAIKKEHLQCALLLIAEGDSFNIP